MMGSCDGGSEFFNCLHVLPLISYLILQNMHCLHYNRDTSTMAPKVLTTPTCASAAPSGIRSLVHVPHAKERYGLRAVTLCPLFNLRWLMYLSIAGRSGWPTAQRLCLPGREFLEKAENLLQFILKFARRFPNPVPSGIRVPQWSLIDVTVRC